MDRLDAMTVLLAAVETGSLSAAGRRLGQPLSTVSRKIAELEAHLGARLLVRTSRRLDLTDAGRTFVAAASRILEDLAEAERAAAGEYRAPTGTLVVTAPVVFGRLHVLPVVTAFLQQHRQIDLQLMLADRVVHLIDDHVDLAVRIGALPDSSLRAQRVGLIRKVTCASPGYLALRGTPSGPGDLAAHDLISFSGLEAPDRWTLTVDGRDQPVPVRPRLVVNTAEAALDAAIAGLGLTRVLSYQARTACKAGQLTEVLTDLRSPPLPVSLVFADQGPMPQKLRAFIDFAAPRLRAALG